VAFVKKELGFHDCIDYKNEAFESDLETACGNGIDIYFENVGGPVTRTVSSILNEGGQECQFVVLFHNIMNQICSKLRHHSKYLAN
jgi:NADPH-dependent curcumin reductase CurA